MSVPEYHLRPATPGDAEFIYSLRRTVYREHVIATWGQWDEPWQRNYFAMRFHPNGNQMICLADQAVGHLEWHWAADRLFLASIELDPAWQGRGIGRSIIVDLLTRARRRDLPMELQVLKTNAAARRLYERLGFTVTDTTPTHHQMRAE